MERNTALVAARVEAATVPAAYARTARMRTAQVAAVEKPTSVLAPLGVAALVEYERPAVEAFRVRGALGARVREVAREVERLGDAHRALRPHAQSLRARLEQSDGVEADGASATLGTSLD